MESFCKSALNLIPESVTTGLTRSCLQNRNSKQSIGDT